MTQPVRLTLTPEFQQALHLIEQTGENVFVTGRAGTGKSTLLRHFRETTKKNIVVLAPTGVAAVNIAGQTIHSFFKFKPDVTVERIKKLTPTKQRLYKKIDTLVIDEISMVRADLLDAVARFLELNGRAPGSPFGGVQMVFFGDLYQLPPVVSREERAIFEGFYETPYFFSARAYTGPIWTWVELTQTFRQTDNAFLDILNRVRNETVLPEDLARLNAQVRETIDMDAVRDYVFLTTTNAKAREINQQQMARLPAKTETFTAFVDGDFGEEAWPTDGSLELKVGARVMLLNNDNLGRWVNGTMAQIRKIDVQNDLLTVTLPDGNDEEVAPYAWEMFRFELDADAKRLNATSVGQFVQMPVKLAWAITIHKSQGLTFDRVVIDLSRGTFSHGQMYVALSRLRRLDGLLLTRPVKKGHILLDRRIQKFITGCQYRLSEEKNPLDRKIAQIETAIQSGRDLEIVYLKATDDKSRRRVTPIDVGEMEYQNKSFLGMTAWCHKRKDERVFRVDRILSMQEVGGANLS